MPTNLFAHLSQRASDNSTTIESWAVVGTFLAVIVALFGPFLVEKWKRKYREAKLEIQFAHKPPDCHKTIFNGNNGWPVYYFRFRVSNVGKTQSEETEAILESVHKKTSSGKYKLETNFTPVNLKWSARDSHRTIQPGRSVFCDLGRIHHTNIEQESVYTHATTDQQRSLKFFFEQAEARLYSQWDCLVPGEYKLSVGIYSKNAEKVTRNFYIKWSGIWKDEESDMFKEIVIK